MGNCVDRQRAVSWVEEEEEYDDRDWASSGESVSSQDDDDNNNNNSNKIDKNGRETPLTATTEVKIKITKKQLEKLLRQVDGKDLTIQEVLADLMSCDQDPGRHWRPALQSIPEVSE